LRHWLSVLMIAAALLAGGAVRAQPVSAAHSDPLNFDPLVRQGYQRFYSMDFDGAWRIFSQVAHEHPQDAMALDYLQLTAVFRSLYSLDLLDTTYYAHDSFLSNKRDTPVPAAERDQIEGLTNRIVAMCDAELRSNPNDKNALFARGFAEGMHAVFIVLADHQFAKGARQGLDARNDSEAVLKLDPQYADAEMAVGIQQFASASLPGWLRWIVGMMGAGGSKQKGIALLRDAAAHGVVTSVESRTALSLFLRHDGRYPEALEVERGLAAEYPHDYLFRLEVANLLKDEGHGEEAMAAYKQVIADAQRPGYFIDARLQMAWFGLADTECGYNQIQAARDGYMQAAEQQLCSDWLRKRAQLNAGEMDDLLHDRQQAIRMYQMAAAPGGDQSQADAARRYMHTPFAGH
jgi:tetratricopeptide (TPR) repeat protein